MRTNGRYAIATLAVAAMITFLSAGHAAPGGAAPQEVRENNRKIIAAGSVGGTILIKEVSGNNVGNFTCCRIKVVASTLSGDSWSKTVSATGNFSSRRCYFNITGIPAGKGFTLNIPTPEFPKACDEKKFEVSSVSFPMTVKTGEKLGYNFTITRIRCVLIT